MSKMWFAPKRFGYGATLPIAWQGWAVYAGYAAALVGAFSLLEQVTPQGLRLAGQVGAILVLTAILITVTRAKTEGGWRWRWGRD
ncbi:MAG: hypothetical protein ACREH4_15785 [Vitreimonas sp.]